MVSLCFRMVLYIRLDSVSDGRHVATLNNSTADSYSINQTVDQSICSALPSSFRINLDTLPAFHQSKASSLRQDAQDVF